MNVEKFNSVQKGFKQFGFTAEQINSMHSILAAIIHLGDLQFIHADSRDNTERCILKNPKLVEPGKNSQNSLILFQEIFHFRPKFPLTYQLKSSIVNYYEFQSLIIKQEIKAYRLFYIMYAFVFFLILHIFKIKSCLLKTQY